jgi:hypothetical protein
LGFKLSGEVGIGAGAFDQSDNILGQKEILIRQKFGIGRQSSLLESGEEGI